ncbi:MAG: hypothetical protein J3R72DRAFT_439704 [Linnemannia gamsii]|nr:MAG: hypothetical protein J3R72DRAFT_439704 [Linnemannia gamsii]
MSNTLSMSLQPNKKNLHSSSSSPLSPSFLRGYLSLIHILILFILFTSNTAFVAAQATTDSTTTTATAATISLTFLDSSGTPLAGSQPQTIPRSTCTTLNTPAFTAPNPENDSDNNITSTTSGYAVATASDQHAALNLYTDTLCQVMVSATVGAWNTSSSPSVTNIKAIRWEGDAPATLTPGTLIPTAFPPNMVTQQISPVEDDGTPKKSHHDKHHHKQEFELDPAKGRFIVGLVSVILMIGILIGIIQVYKATQYVPPARSRPGSILSEKGGYSNVGGGNGYGGGGGIGTVGARKIKKKEAYYRKPITSSSYSSTFATGNNQQQQFSASRSSMATLATLRATESPGSSPAITIDMHESSSTLLLHPTQGHSGSSSQSLTSSSHSRLPSQPPCLEVLVPMQSLEGQIVLPSL